MTADLNHLFTDRGLSQDWQDAADIAHLLYEKGWRPAPRIVSLCTCREIAGQLVKELCPVHGRLNQATS